MNLIQSTASIALLLAFAPAAWSAGNTGMTEAQRQYQQERSVCVSGQSHQDRATCMQEAGAAYAEARRGALANAAGSDFDKNAIHRCDAQPRADRPACVQRILGAGSTEGSVEGGGLIRETETKLP